MSLRDVVDSFDYQSDTLAAYVDLGAFRRFKDEVARMGLSEDWRAFRGDARADFARGFLEEHGVRWR